MSRTDDRRDRTLPVTSEVGGEGGSYADPTLQVETFSGAPHGLRRASGVGGPSSAANQGVRGDEIAGGGADSSPDPDRGMIRYPTEPPPSPPAAMGRRLASRIDWRTAALSAAAGASLAWFLRRR